MCMSPLHTQFQRTEPNLQNVKPMTVVMGLLVQNLPASMYWPYDRMPPKSLRLKRRRLRVFSRYSKDNFGYICNWSKAHHTWNCFQYSLNFLCWNVPSKLCFQNSLKIGNSRKASCKSAVYFAKRFRTVTYQSRILYQESSDLSRVIRSFESFPHWALCFVSAVDSKVALKLVHSTVVCWDTTDFHKTNEKFAKGKLRNISPAFSFPQLLSQAFDACAIVCSQAHIRRNIFCQKCLKNLQFCKML